jgi:hypothetical protein
MASRGLVSAKDFFFLRVVLVIILFWVATWNLVEEGIEYLEDHTQLKKVHIYGSLFIVCLLFIIFDPDVFEKL